MQDRFKMEQAHGSTRLPTHGLLSYQHLFAYLCPLTGSTRQITPHFSPNTSSSAKQRFAHNNAQAGRVESWLKEVRRVRICADIPEQKSEESAHVFAFLIFDNNISY
jgi:hypothetical protein